MLDQTEEKLLEESRENGMRQQASAGEGDRMLAQLARVGAFALIPIVGALLGGLLAAFRPPGAAMRSYIQHFAAVRLSRVGDDRRACRLPARQLLQEQSHRADYPGIQQRSYPMRGSGTFASRALPHRFRGATLVVPDRYAVRRARTACGSAVPIPVGWAEVRLELADA